MIKTTYKSGAYEQCPKCGRVDLLGLKGHRCSPVDFYEHHPDLAVQRPDLVKSVRLVDDLREADRRIAALRRKMVAKHERRERIRRFEAAFGIFCLLAFGALFGYAVSMAIH